MEARGSGTGLGLPEPGVAITAEVYTPRSPSEAPSMFKVKSESESVGSLVVKSGKPVFGSKRKTDNASGEERELGPLVVASRAKEKAVPSVRPVKYSLKKDKDESARVTVPGKVPLTDPLGKTAPRVPSVEKSDMVTVLEGPPP